MVDASSELLQEDLSRLPSSPVTDIIRIAYSKDILKDGIRFDCLRGRGDLYTAVDVPIGRVCRACLVRFMTRSGGALRYVVVIC